VSSAPSVLVATRSAGKVRELRPIFAAFGVPTVSLEELGIDVEPAEEEIERFATFEENALAKARYFYEVSGGIATVADDSGLEVLALGGAPGVRSKRWSRDLAGGALGGPTSGNVDAANNATLVRAVAGLDDRRARYVCAAAFVTLGRELVRRGEVAGSIVTEPRGQGGFGYDPYFLAAELGRTFGEATLTDKEQVSHRGRAFRALLEAVARGD